MSCATSSLYQHSLETKELEGWGRRWCLLWTMALLSSLVVIWFDCLTFFSWTSWHKFHLRGTTASETLWSGYMLRRTVCFQKHGPFGSKPLHKRATAGSKELAENMGSVAEEVRKFRDHLEVIHCSATEEWNHQIMCSMMRKNCKFFFAEWGGQTRLFTINLFCTGWEYYRVLGDGLELRFKFHWGLCKRPPSNMQHPEGFYNFLDW